MTLLVNPFFKVSHIESMSIIYFLFFQPVYERWKMLLNLFSIEYSVNHVAAEEPHFYFVPCMTIDFFVLMYLLKNVGSSRSI